MARQIPVLVAIMALVAVALSAVPDARVAGLSDAASLPTQGWPSNTALEHWCRAPKTVRQHDELILCAECWTIRGAWRSSLLNLGECFGNDDGVLVPQESGDFLKSCRDCHLGGDGGKPWTSLTCKCHSGTWQDWPETTVDINRAVSETLDGRLQCHSMVGNAVVCPRGASDVEIKAVDRAVNATTSATHSGATEISDTAATTIETTPIAPVTSTPVSSFVRRALTPETPAAPAPPELAVTSEQGVYPIGGTCKNFTMSRQGAEVYFCGLCDDVSRGFGQSLINLADCVENLDGKLSGKRFGNAFETCNRCSLDKTKLKCSCRNRDWSRWEATGIDLDSVVSNSDGQFKCYDVLGVTHHCPADFGDSPAGLGSLDFKSATNTTSVARRKERQAN